MTVEKQVECKNRNLISFKAALAAAWLAQLGERRSAEQEVAG